MAGRESADRSAAASRCECGHIRKAHESVLPPKGACYMPGCTEPKLRGKFRYNTNHFPIQNFYAQEVAKDAQGEFTMKTLSTVFTDMKDVFYEKCPMK